VSAPEGGAPSRRVDTAGVVIAAALGLIVPPVLWLVLIVAVLWLFTRRGSWSHGARY